MGISHSAGAALSHSTNCSAERDKWQLRGFCEGPSSLGLYTQRCLQQGAADTVDAVLVQVRSDVLDLAKIKC